MMRKFMRNNFSAFVLSFVLVMSFVSSAQAADINLSSAVLINSGNKSQYDGKTITGTIPDSSSAGGYDFFISAGAIVIDGIELNLTIDGLNVDYSGKYSMLSGISLVNGAKLHLTVKGENNLKAGFGGAGIAVPDGCTLEITAASTGTLNATGGKNYGGGAGIGSIGDHMNTQTQANGIYPQGLGNITINGGTINAQGGTWYYYYEASGGAAGIGSSEYSGATTTGVTYGDSSYINNITGSVTINGGTVNATGGLCAAGIGGGDTGTLNSITITGGTVTANGGYRASAIGLGFNGWNRGAGSLKCPTISISGGNVTANGSIGYGEAHYSDNNNGGTITLSLSDASGSIYAQGYGAGTVKIEGDELIATSGTVCRAYNAGTVSDVSGLAGKTLTRNLTQYSVSVASGIQHGSVTVSPASLYPGHNVTITATPSAGYELESLTVKDAENRNVSVNGNSFVMPQSNVTVSATFMGVLSSITVQASEQGTVTADKTRARAGETVTLTATPVEGYALDFFTVRDAGGNTITVTNNSFTMPSSNVTVRARFIPARYSVTTESAGNGTVTANKAIAGYGETVTLTVTPDEHYELESLTVDGTSFNGRTFTMPAHNVTVSATFKGITKFAVTVQTPTNGTLTADKTTGIYAGEKVTLTLAPSSGYVAGTITVTPTTGGSQVAVHRYSLTAADFIMPASDVTVSANFEQIISENTRYIDENGAEHSTSAQTLTLSSTAWSNGWYVAKGTVDISTRVPVEGDVHLILTDGAVLNIPKGITVTGDNKLTIYGQNEGTGKLTINDVDDYCAGIGGAGQYENGGVITICGGTFDVAGYYNENADSTHNGAGIGGGVWGTGGTITIYGGTVKATGYNNAAGIGGGYYADGGNIAIYGGQITARVGSSYSYGKTANVTLGWTKESDFISSDLFYIANTITVKEGQCLKDEVGNVYWGTLTDAQKTAIQTGAKLTPDLNAHMITLGTVTGGTVEISKTAAHAGDTITITPTAGYVLESVTATDGITDCSVTFTSETEAAPATFTMPDNDVTVNVILRVHSLLGYSDICKPDGTANNPYIISSSEGWDMFCSALNNSAWNNFEGMTVKLDDDIATGNMAERFKGTFDGDGHTLTFTYASTQTDPAPFRYVEGTVTIKNLHVAGTIETSKYNAAGLIANQSGTTTIENCRVSVEISFNGAKYAVSALSYGGFVSEAGGTVNITGCVFDGKMLGSNGWGCGGFVGKNKGTVNISSSLFAPSEVTMNTTKTGPNSVQCATFSRINAPTITNGYYTELFGTEQGVKGYTVSASGNGITVKLAESSEHGMMYDGVIYAGAGETVTLEITANGAGYSVSECTASAGELTKTAEGVYTLVMPDNANVTITATISTAEYTISYELNGGEIPDGLSNPVSYGVNSGITILANPERKGYEFTGWTGTGLDGETMTVMIPTGSTGDRSYVAHWQVITYTIGYDLNGGNVSGNPESYTVASDAITLNNPTRAGYKFSGWTGTEISGTSLNVTIPQGSTGNRSYSATWKSLSPFGYTDSYTPDGSSSKPYRISGVEGWKLLADELNGGESYSGKNFSLEANLEVTTMLGMNGTGFAGVFEGNGKTLTVNYDSDFEYSAPFVYVNGGTIKDLTVTGTIKTSGQHVGGIVGQSSGETTIEACNFVGKLLTTNVGVTIGGGFVAENNGTLTISKSLYAPATIADGETEANAEGSATFSRNTDSHTSEITTSYYTRPLGTAQGKQGYTITAETGITVALAEGSTNGLSFDGTIYAGSNETVSLTISGGSTKEGYTFKGYSAGVATLTESDGKYSLTMPTANVTISANFAENVSYKDANGNEATASDYTVMTSDMTNLTAGTYVVKESVTVSALTLGGDVNLILCDGATLTVTGEVSGANSLVIFGQTNGTGKTTATTITLTGNKDLSVYGGNLTAGTISVAGTVTVKRATVNNETYDANGDSTTNYTVTFDSNGGSAVDSQTLRFKYGESVKATKPADPTRANYDFVEWQLNGTAYDFGTAVTGDMTLTAKWTATEYTITYNGTDGATFTTANPTKYTVETATFTLTNPTKNGSTFKGWTGTGLSEATKSVTITKGSTGKRTYTATWTGGGSDPDPNVPTFSEKHSLILDGEIGMKFYVYLPELSGVDYANSYMEFDISGDKSNGLKYYNTNNTRDIDGKTYHYFVCYLSSVQMADKVTATFHYGDNLTVSQESSVKEYLDNILEGSFSGTAKNLMNAIQDYGHFSQLMLSKANNWTIGKEFSEMPASFNDASYNASEIQEARDGVKDYAIVRDTGDSGIEKVEFSLLLDSKTTINVYLTVKSTHNGTVSATFNGTEATKLSDGRYLVQIRNIPAHELATMYEINVTAGSSFTIKVAALSYVNTMLAKGDGTVVGGVDIATMRNAVTALYMYYAKTIEYRERPNE